VRYSHTSETRISRHPRHERSCAHQQLYSCSVTQSSHTASTAGESMGLNADLTPLAADGQSLDESSAAAGACSPRKGTASSSLSSNSQLHAHALQGQPDAEQDSRKPIYHVMPLSGWSSDPCGAIRYKGNYHL
jgi:hypothetical protein